MKVCTKCGKSGKRYLTVVDNRRGTSREERICTDCKYEMTRKWKADHRERINQKNKEWVQNNREKYNASQCKTYHKYHDRNKKRVLSYYYKLKERFGMSPATVYRNGGKKVIEELLKNWKCRECGTTEDINIHHKDNQGRLNKRLGLKPNNNISNLEILCRSCHTAQHQREKKYGTKTNERRISA